MEKNECLSFLMGTIFNGFGISVSGACIHLFLGGPSTAWLDFFIHLKRSLEWIFLAFNL